MDFGHIRKMLRNSKILQNSISVNVSLRNFPAISANGMQFGGNCLLIGPTVMPVGDSCVIKKWSNLSKTSKMALQMYCKGLTCEF